MHLAVGNDHRGLKLKKAVLAMLRELDHSYQDFGARGIDSVDYPDISLQVARGVAQGKFDRGILVCSTGVGMCISANKINGIRAASCSDSFSARRCREHNDCNVLCLGEDVVKEELAQNMVQLFLSTPFEGGRHQHRLDKIRAMETE